jgi:hypothetical protein
MATPMPSSLYNKNIAAKKCNNLNLGLVKPFAGDGALLFCFFTLNLSTVCQQRKGGRGRDVEYGCLIFIFKRNDGCLGAF